MATQDNIPRNFSPLTPISDEALLKIAKEITVKFIEVGRITPATFPTAFAGIYSAIEKTVRNK